MSMFVRTNSIIWGSVNQSDYKDSIVFIEDTEQIYSNGVCYGGKNNNGLLLEKITFSKESISLNPDKFYVSDTILETLDITLNGDTTRMNTYFVEFMCDNTCVILPSNIKWKNNIVPDFTKTAIMTIKIQDDTAYLIDCRLLDLCVTFTAQQDNSSIGLSKLSTYQTLEYSRDRSNWSNMSTTTNISLNNGDKVYIRGVLSADNTGSNYTQFKMSGKIAASGNCNAIWNYQDLNAPLKQHCGYNMFYQCSSLTTAPELPATELAKDCYKFMFYGCTSLATAPELPATKLAEYCYQTMFENCTNLNHIKCLATDISAIDCTYKWVNNVSPSGIFIKHPNMNNWNTGYSSIPSGWTIEDAKI